MRITSSHIAFQFFRNQLPHKIEEFWIASLNPNKDLIAYECLFRGTADACLIHMRDIFRHNCENNASSFIIAHNHPSNDPKPSAEDLILTRKIEEAGLLMQIPLEDHLVVTKSRYTSFADSGLLLRARFARS